MANLSNKFNLRESIFRAIQDDDYDRGESEITTTELVGPIQAAVLKKRYDKQITIDAMSRVKIFIGKCVHAKLEKSAPAGTITEKRYYADVDGVKLGGQIDILEEKDKRLLVDFKTTSVWTMVYGGRDDWEKQANVNRWLLHKNGLTVDCLEDDLIFRDWKERELNRVKNYPKAEIITWPMTMWPLEETEAYIMERVHHHKMARDMSDQELLEYYDCTPAETWKNRIRCQKYCDASEFCKSWAYFKER